MKPKTYSITDNKPLTRSINASNTKIKDFIKESNLLDNELNQLLTEFDLNNKNDFYGSGINRNKKVRGGMINNDEYPDIEYRLDVLPNLTTNKLDDILLQIQGAINLAVSKNDSLKEDYYKDLLNEVNQIIESRFENNFYSNVYNGEYQKLYSEINKFSNDCFYRIIVPSTTILKKLTNKDTYKSLVDNLSFLKQILIKLQEVKSHSTQVDKFLSYYYPFNELSNVDKEIVENILV